MTNNTARDVLVNSAYKIVRAIAILFLKLGVGYPVFSELARKAFADAATEFEVEGRKLSDSRMAIVTGLSRKEIKRLKELSAYELQEFDSSHNRAVRVVTAWSREQKYLTSRGKPRVLAVSDESPSLHELVSEFGGGVPTRAVIDELSRVGAIVETRKGYWKLLDPAYLSRESDATAMKILGEDVSQLIKTIDHNLEAVPEDKFFQRKVMYLEVPETEAHKFRKYASAESFKLLQRLDRWLANTVSKLEDNPLEDDQVYKTGVSVFYIEDPQDEDSDNNK